MKSDLGMGLVSAGSVNRSFLARMPALHAHLGPVKATSFLTAKTAVRTLRAGYAVSHYYALELCKVIWIAVPETSLDRLSSELAAQMPVHRTMVVICDCVRESTAPNALTKTGARIATVNPVEGTREAQFVAEGDGHTVNAIKRLLSTERRKLLVLEPGAKPLYFAGLHLATHLVTPWVDASVRTLRAAGFPRANAVEIAEALVRKVLRDYENSGTKYWDDRASADLKVALSREASRLREADKHLGDYYAQGIRQALEYFPRRKAAAAAVGH
jgi:predicted short-subunit dehydrogenase-like oxidoreductase (DUF2520 family)